ncbi:MAG: hypothetical protein LBH75_02085 [Treponema sp.]|jgi:hypothetical protein|nr:hypothetical protein [Treponema sp.]
MIRISLVLGAVIVYLGCVLIDPAEKAGQLIGRTLPQKTTVVYAGKDFSLILGETNKVGHRNGMVKLAEFPFLRLQAEMRADDSFSWTELHFLGGSPSGWNEFTQELTGDGSIRFTESFAFLNVPLTERGRITGANMLYKDDKLQGERALSNMSNRAERIDALAQWMHTQLEDMPVHFANERIFTDYWRPILLPETVPARKRPSAWTDAGPWVTAEEVKWNTSYTAHILPEHLRSARNSGALLRDWEEALSWLYLDYEWDYVQNLFSQDSLTLVREQGGK